jgi:hypothetical protein
MDDENKRRTHFATLHALSTFFSSAAIFAFIMTMFHFGNPRLPRRRSHPNYRHSENCV